MLILSMKSYLIFGKLLDGIGWRSIFEIDLDLEVV